MVKLALLAVMAVLLAGAGLFRWRDWPALGRRRTAAG
jgi:hypothetical protein